MKPRIVRCAMLLLTLLANPCSAGEILLVLASQPGDYIGLGEQRLITIADADFVVSRNFGNGVSFWINDFGRPDSQGIWWSVDLAAAGGAELAAGAYEGATRFPFQDASEPGLSVYGEGRGCNTLTGRFDVLEAVYDGQTGEVLHFAADFEQHCEGMEPALLGAVRYDSDVPVSIKVPPVMRVDTPLNYQGCAEATSPAGADVSLTAVQQAGGDYLFRWSTSTGRTGEGADFVVPVALDEPVTVTLTQVDLATNEPVSVSRPVCASDTTPPLVEILAPEDGKQYVSRSIPLEVRITDTVDQAIAQYSVTVGYEVTMALTAGHGQAQLPPTKTTKSGTETMLRVEAQDAHGNVGMAWRWITLAHDSRR